MCIVQEANTIVLSLVMGFWENVENTREFKNMTRKELAYRAHFSINSISTGIARNSIPAADVACRIAQELGVSVEFLVTGNNQNEKREQSGPEERLIASRLLDKKSNLMKYADKYAAVLEDFSAIAPDMQKLLADLIHKMARA